MPLYIDNEVYFCEKCGNSDAFGFALTTVVTLKKNPDTKEPIIGEQKSMFVCMNCNHKVIAKNGASK